MMTIKTWSGPLDPQKRVYVWAKIAQRWRTVRVVRCIKGPKLPVVVPRSQSSSRHGSVQVLKGSCSRLVQVHIGLLAQSDRDGIAAGLDSSLPRYQHGNSLQVCLNMNQRLRAQLLARLVASKLQSFLELADRDWQFHLQHLKTT